MHSRFVVPMLAVTLAAAAACPGFAQVSARPETRQTSQVSGPYGIIATVAGNGWSGFYGVGVLATHAEFDSPEAVAVDSSGNLYIADTFNNMIRKVTAATGDISTVAGSPKGGYVGDKGLANKALLYEPSGLAFDSKGNLFIADSGNNVVREVNATTGIITTVAGFRYATDRDAFCGFSGDNGPATKAELCYPTGLAVDGAGDLFISDSNNLVVREVNAATGIIATVAGNYYGGIYGPSSEGSPAISVQLQEPRGIALDPNGNLYIADEVDCLVRKVTASTGLIATVAGTDVSYASGNCGYAEEGVPATKSGLWYPMGVALDSAGNLFIADEYNDLVRRVDAKTGIVTTVAGDLIGYKQPSGLTLYNGAYGYTGDGGAATVAQLAGPFAVAVDNAVKMDSLYIADFSNDAIRKVVLSLAATTPAPTITPSGAGYGLGFAGTLQVTLHESASGATIYYTTNGTTPTTASQTYSGPITLSKSASVIAFATSAGTANSDAAQGNYYKLPAPAISPNGGAFTKPQSVVLSLAVIGDISYTTDGSDPCTSTSARPYFNRYIALSTSVTLKAVASIGGGCGPVATANFTIPAAPVVVTGNAINVEATSAILNGTVNPGDLATTYWFAYGANCNNLALITAKKSLRAVKITENVSADITGLEKSSPYCFQLFATNSLGTNSGQDGNFTTQ